MTTRFTKRHGCRHPFASAGLAFVLLPVPETTGEREEMPRLAGQAVGLITDIRPARQIVEGMMREAAAVLAGFQPRLE